MTEGPIVIVSPAVASSNNGNWHTASRWRTFLSAEVSTEILQHWNGEPAGAVVALHARKSAQSIARFRELHPRRPLALVLTGTDVYGNLEADDVTRRSLALATHLVVLQEEALNRLCVDDRAKARVIVQSAPAVLCEDTRDARCDFVAVGHLRSEKDPLTLMGAARLLQGDNTRIVHIGDALDPALGYEARRTMNECPNYLWLGGLAQPEARQRIACARALIHMSRLEGGANVVIEAVRSRVPVLASKIDGNIGLLGHDYEGYFAAGDPLQLAHLVRRMQGEPALANRLRVQCGLRESLFAPSVEAAAVLALWSDLQSFSSGDR